MIRNYYTGVCNPCGNTIEECECKDRAVLKFTDLPPERQLITELEPLDIELDTQYRY